MRRLNITVIAGILAAVVGVAIVLTYGKGVDKRVADGKQTVGVLVAADVLVPGATPAALASKVEVKQVPRAYVGVDAIGSLTALPNGSILRVPVAKGTQISKAAFSTSGASGVAGPVAPAKGSSALAIKVGMVPGVAHYVVAGSTVDLFVTYKAVKADPNALVTTPVVTKLFASAVHVLSVTGNGQTAAQAAPDDVLLIIEATPALAQMVINAQAAGELYVALTGGEVHATSGGATPADVLKGSR